MKMKIPDELISAVEKRAGEYGAKKVWLFGSVLAEGIYSAGDIDLAIEGIPPENFYPFYGDIVGDMSDKYGKMTDLVDMDNDRGMIIPIVHERGVVIYGK